MIYLLPVSAFTRLGIVETTYIISVTRAETEKGSQGSESVQN